MDKPFAAYAGDEPYVFVSYAHADADRVFPEIQWLHEQGFNVWYDEGIEPGSVWRDELARALDGAALFLFFVTPTSIDRPHCVREVAYAVDHEFPFLAIHLEETDLDPGIELTLSSIQAILKYDTRERAYRQKLLRFATQHVDRGAVEVRPVRQMQGWSTSKGALVVVISVVSMSALTWWLAASVPLETPNDGAIPAVVRTTIDIPDDIERIGGFRLEAETLVYYGYRDRERRLFTRFLYSTETIDLPVDAEFALRPFLSPDGKWVGYRDLRDGDFKRVRADGTGAPIEIVRTDIASGMNVDGGVAWGPDDRIVFSNITTAGLMSATTSSSLAVPLTFASDSKRHAWPSFFANGDILINVQEVGATQVLGVAVYSARDQQVLPLLEPQPTTSGAFVLPGNLVGLSPDGVNLMAGRYDPETQRLGSLVPVYQVGSNLRPIAHSATTDRFVERELPADFGKSQLVWVDPATGEETELSLPLDYYREPRLSPDGTEVVFVLGNDDDPEQGNALVVYSLTRKQLRTVHTDTRYLRNPVWSPNGNELYFGMANEDDDIYRVDAYGVSDLVEILVRDGYQSPTSISPDGRTLYYNDIHAIEFHISSLSLENREYDKVVENDASNYFGTISPDGMLLAYSAWIDSVPRIYVKDLETDAAPLVVGAGASPVWSRTGTRLYHGTLDSNAKPFEMRSVEIIDGEPSSDITTHFSVWDYRYYPGGPNYDAAADGRLLMVKRVETPVVPFTLTQNWFANVRDQIPPIE